METILFCETLAEVQHEIWSHWMKYLFSVGHLREDGTYVIDSGNVRRWKRQMNTAYADLTEKEKESDRHKADKVLAVL